MEDFSRKGLHEHEEPVSCTSALCKWTKPRTLQTTSAPVQSLTIRKYQYGQDYTKKSSVNFYDPRAPHQRQTRHESIESFCEEFKATNVKSSLFLFHEVTPQFAEFAKC